MIRRLGCWGWLLVLVFAVACVVGGMMAWYLSDSDLRRVDARARSMGVPLEWSALARTPSPYLADWQRLMQLGEALQSYQDFTEYAWKGPRVGVAVPPEVQRHHASLSAQDVAELDQLLDRLDGQRVIEHAAFGARTLLPSIGGVRQIVRLLIERTVFVLDADLLREFNRGGRLATSMEDGTGIMMLVRQSILSMWCQAVVVQAPRLDAATRYALAEQAMALSRVLGEEEPKLPTYEFLGMRSSIAE